MRRTAALLVSSLGLLPAAANADSPWQRTFTAEEVAADLSYGICPLYLAGQVTLTGDKMLTERGFGAKVSKQTTPRFGVIEQVEANRPDGRFAFGGIPGKVCSVTVTDAGMDSVSARLHRDIKLMGIPFKADPPRLLDRGKTKVETFKGPLDGKVLQVQLVQILAPKPMIVVQLFGMAN